LLPNERQHLLCRKTTYPLPHQFDYNTYSAFNASFFTGYFFLSQGTEI
jgi:hypothetical protein